MPYCTIEEAWSQSLNPELQTISNHNGNDVLPNQYIELQNSTLYDSEGKSITCKKEKKQKKKMPNMSRTYNRLPEHSGPVTRFENDNQQVYVRNKDSFELDDRKNHPSYMNLDAPINDNNISMYEKLNDEYNKNFKENSEESSMMEDFTTLENNYSGDTAKYKRKGSRQEKNEYEYIVNELKEENSRLKTMINELKNSKVEDKDSFLDIVVFLATGVVIILMMENISKLLRKF